MIEVPFSSAIKTVLVVDDEVIARMMISEYLRDCGYKVIKAGTTDEALAVLQHSDLDISILLCGMSQAGAAAGFALSHWVRSNHPGTEIILAGNHARAVDPAGDLCESGPALAKPYEPQVVLDRIKQLLAVRASRKK